MNVYKYYRKYGTPILDIAGYTHPASMEIEISQLKIETPESILHGNKEKRMAELKEQAGERLARMRMIDSRSLEDKCLKQFKVESNMKKHAAVVLFHMAYDAGQLCDSEKMQVQLHLLDLNKYQGIQKVDLH